MFEDPKRLLDDFIFATSRLWTFNTKFYNKQQSGVYLLVSLLVLEE